MAKNKLTDLNNHLFEMLERLNDDELMESNAEEEIRRANAITQIGSTIIQNGQLMLDAQKHADEYGYSARERKLPNILSLEDKDE